MAYKMKYNEVITVLDENNNVKYHTDGNVMYIADKVSYTYKTEKEQHPTLKFVEEQLFNLEEFNKYDILLEETMHVKELGKAKFIEFYNPVHNCKVCINKNFLLKHTKLYTRLDKSYLSAICIKDMNNEVIGVVMPVQHPITVEAIKYEKSVLL